MKTWLAVWKLLDARRRRQLIGLQCVAVLMALSTLGGISGVLPFFAVLADPAQIDGNAWLHAAYMRMHFAGAQQFIVALGVVLVAGVWLSNTINLFGSLAMSRFALSVGDDFHAALLDEYLHRDPAFHAREGGSKLYGRVLYSANRAAGGILESGMIAATSAVTVLVVAASVVLLNGRIAGAAALWIGGSYALVYLLARRSLLRNGALETRHLAERSRAVTESLAAIKEILVYGKQEHFRRALADACRAISFHAIRNQAIAQLPRYAMECVTVAGLVGTALYLGASQSAVGVSLAQLSFLGFAAYRLLPAVQQGFAAVVRIRANQAVFEDIAEDLRAALSRTAAAREAAPAAEWQARPRREIRLEEVSFRHAPEREAALQAVSLRIPAGSMCAIVGANGSGKTTLVDVLLGLLTPAAGAISVDGVRIDARTRAAWQRQLAYVPQDIAVFDTGLRANIALGTPAAAVDAQRLAEAVRRARLTELLRSLPAGYDEPLGDRGTRLSGGQRQRIGIARALYFGASVLVLDEATSALDGTTEREILEVLEELRGEYTLVVVSHRPDTIRRCDWVFELTQGRLTATTRRADPPGATRGARAALEHSS